MMTHGAGGQVAVVAGRGFCLSSHIPTEVFKQTQGHSVRRSDLLRHPCLANLRVLKLRRRSHFRTL